MINSDKNKMKKFTIILSVLVTIAMTTNAQWQLANGPYGGSIASLATSGSNIFAGTYSGVFLSTNNGTSWSQVNNGLTNLNINSLAISENNIFAGTYGGVFLSNDNGTSWTEVNNGLTNNSIMELAINGTNIFAGTYGGGMFLSTDN
jgi:ligand-binding sensor domain-containing protein